MDGLTCGLIMDACNFCRYNRFSYYYVFSMAVNNTGKKYWQYQYQYLLIKVLAIPIPILFLKSIAIPVPILFFSYYIYPSSQVICWNRAHESQFMEQN